LVSAALEKQKKFMTYMHCKVRFTDYAKWKASMDADGPAQRAAGLTLKHLWRGVDDPNTAFFVLEIQDQAKARAFLAPAAVAKAKADAGAVDFEWCFVESVPGR
jgi:hypothetical protein